MKVSNLLPRFLKKGASRREESKWWQQERVISYFGNQVSRLRRPWFRNARLRTTERVLSAFPNHARVRTRKGAELEITPLRGVNVFTAMRTDRTEHGYNTFHFIAKPASTENLQRLEHQQGDYTPLLKHLNKAAGYFSGEIALNEKEPVAIISNIQTRNAFFSLSSREKRQLGDWDEAVLQFLEQGFRQAGVKKIIIFPKEIAARGRTVGANIFEKHYEQLPKSQGYSKQLIPIEELGFEAGPLASAPFMQLAKKTGFWVKELRA